MEMTKEAMDALTASLKQTNDSIANMSGVIETLKTQIGGYESRIVGIEKGEQKRLVSLPGVELEKEKFSFARSFVAIATKDWSNAQFEKAVFDEARKKVLVVGTPASGGYMVPQQFIAEVIELIRANLVCLKLGATELNGLQSSPVDIPKQSGGGTFAWIGENSAITPADQAFDQVALTPHQASAMTIVTNRLLRMATPSIETLVRQDLAKVIAGGIDLGALRGSGAPPAPTGIALTPNILTEILGGAGLTPTIDHLLEMLYKLKLNNTASGKLGWAFHPRTWFTLSKIKDKNNRYILNDTIAANGTPKTLLGMPYEETTQIPINGSKGGSLDLSEIYLGNWMDLVIASWGGLELAASSETSDAFAKNLTYIRAIQEVDFGVRHPESFVLCADARP